jgi:hypothetical protein
MNKTTNATASTLEAVPVKPGLSALVKGLLFVVVFFAILGMAGHSDYIDEVYYSIPDAAFEEIALKLGDHATRSEIVDEYMDGRAYYDALASYGTSEISRIFPED